MEEALKDERFSHILTDPRFRKMPRHIRKVTVDKRFKQMFKDKTFKEKSAVDKRGRPLNLAPSENLKKLYNITSESSESEDPDTKDLQEKVKTKVKLGKNSKAKIKNDDKSTTERSSLDQSSCQDSNSQIQKCMKKVCNNFETNNMCHLKKKEPIVFSEEDCENSSKQTTQHVTESKEESSEEGEDINDLDSDEDSDSEDSDSDESSSSEQVLDEDFDHRWEELREDAPDTDQVTHRLAVCNMDWDRIRAEDLYTVFNSFKPADGCIKSVKIYPSEFGLKRMEEEKLHGPPELVEETLAPDEEETEDKKGSRYHREKLRQYQLNRLKYYYAVVECDSAETANSLYEQLNGMEYESSSVRLDIRIIPDDVTFDHEPVSMAEKMPDPTEYKPKLFVTTALQQVKVNLTWDETDPKRRETLQRAFTEPDNIEKDLKDYLASSSSESDGNNEDSDNSDDEKLTTKDRIAKYKALLQSLEEKEKEDENKYEMEITWEPGLKEKTEEIVKERLHKDSLNPFEEMLQKKKKEKKKKSKEKKLMNKQVSEELSVSEESDDEFFSSKTGHLKTQDTKQLAELSLMSDSKKIDKMGETKSKKGKKRKPKVEEESNFKCNVNDPRFSAIYSSHLYNIDPSDPHFKKTEGSVAFIQEKQRKLKYANEHKNDRKSNKRTKF